MKPRDATLRARYLRAIGDDVKARLAASLHKARFLDLGIEDDPKAVQPGWRYHSANQKRDYHTVLEAFEGADYRLLLLGHPGAGKTTALLHIAEELANAAVESDDAAIPVILNLSKFRMTRQAPGGRFSVSKAAKARIGSASDRVFENWLVGEITRLTGLDRTTAIAWLGERRIAVLLDGLDEFNDELRGDLVRMLNTAFLPRYPILQLVICSRIHEYKALEDNEATRLQLGGSVQLQPLSPEQVAEYLQAAQAQGLLDALADDEALRELSKTPLTLAMLVLAYGGNAPSIEARGKSLSESRYQLFESYIARMLQRQARRDRNAPMDDVKENDLPESCYRVRTALIHKWLGWLALMLSVRMRTVLHPDALARVLGVANDPRRQLFNFWVFYASVGIVMAGALALIAVPLIPGTAIGIGAAVAVVAAFWLIAPWAAAGSRDWAPGLPVAGLAWLVAGLFAAGLIPRSATLILPADISPYTLAPILVAGLPILVAAWRDDIGDTGKILAGVSAAIAVTALFHFFPSLQLAVPGTVGGVEVRAMLPAALTSLCIIVSIVAIVSDEGWVAATMVFGGFVIGAGLLAGNVYVFRDYGWMQVLGAFGAVFVALLTLEVRGAVVGVLFGSLPVLVGASLWGPGAAVLIAAAFALLLACIWPEMPGDKFYGLETLRDRVFGFADARIFSPLGWVLLALSGRFPLKRGRFLASAKDAFLVKVSMTEFESSEFEFVHRLLRDHFALRALMPRLRSDADRVATIRVLGFQGEAALDMLVEYAREGGVAERAAAISGLGHIASPISTAQIERSLADAEIEVRREVILAMPKLPQDVQIRFFGEMRPLHHTGEIDALLEAFPITALYSHRHVQRVFVENIGETCINYLLDQIKNTRSPLKKVGQIWYLAYFREARIVDAVIELLRDRSPQIRRAAVEVLAIIHDKRAIGHIEELIGDRDKSVARAVFGALTELKEPAPTRRYRGY